VDCWLGYHVQVVEHQDKGLRHAPQQIVDQDLNNEACLRGRVVEGVQKVLGGGTALQVQALEGGDQGGQEAGGVVIFLLQREPGQGQLGTRAGQRSQEGGLPVAGRGGNQHDPVRVERRVQRVYQALAGDNVCAQEGWLEPSAYWPKC
jgi:hypothetical protein